MKRRVQAQRKFAQGAPTPLNNVTNSERSNEVTNMIPNREEQRNVIHNSTAVNALLDIVCFNNLHKHKKPVVLLERLNTSLSNPYLINQRTDQFEVTNDITSPIENNANRNSMRLRSHNINKKSEDDGPLDIIESHITLHNESRNSTEYGIENIDNLNESHKIMNKHNPNDDNNDLVKQSPCLNFNEVAQINSSNPKNFTCTISEMSMDEDKPLAQYVTRKKQLSSVKSRYYGHNHNKKENKIIKRSGPVRLRFPIKMLNANKGLNKITERKKSNEHDEDEDTEPAQSKRIRKNSIETSLDVSRKKKNYGGIDIVVPSHVKKQKLTNLPSSSKENRDLEDLETIETFRNISPVVSTNSSEAALSTTCSIARYQNFNSIMKAPKRDILNRCKLCKHCIRMLKLVQLRDMVDLANLYEYCNWSSDSLCDSDSGSSKETSVEQTQRLQRTTSLTKQSITLELDILKKTSLHVLHISYCKNRRHENFKPIINCSLTPKSTVNFELIERLYAKAILWYLYKNFDIAVEESLTFETENETVFIEDNLMHITEKENSQSMSDRLEIHDIMNKTVNTSLEVDNIVDRYEAVLSMDSEVLTICPNSNHTEIEALDHSTYDLDVPLEPSTSICPQKDNELLTSEVMKSRPSINQQEKENSSAFNTQYKIALDNTHATLNWIASIVEVGTESENTSSDNENDDSEVVPNTTSTPVKNEPENMYLEMETRVLYDESLANELNELHYSVQNNAPVDTENFFKYQPLSNSESTITPHFASSNDAHFIHNNIQYENLLSSLEPVKNPTYDHSINQHTYPVTMQTEPTSSSALCSSIVNMYSNNHESPITLHQTFSSCSNNRHVSEIFPREATVMNQSHVSTSTNQDQSNNAPCMQIENNHTTRASQQIIPLSNDTGNTSIGTVSRTTTNVDCNYKLINTYQQHMHNHSSARSMQTGNDLNNVEDSITAYSCSSSQNVTETLPKKFYNTSRSIDSSDISNYADIDQFGPLQVNNKSIEKREPQNSFLFKSLAIVSPLPSNNSPQVNKPCNASTSFEIVPTSNVSGHDINSTIKVIRPELSHASTSKGTTNNSIPNYKFNQNPTNNLQPNQRRTFLNAPVFTPTAAEFKDPVAFMDSIIPLASKYGICKVVPPEDFAPTCALNDEMIFNVTNQYVTRLFSRWGPGSREMSSIKAYLASQSVVFKRAPLYEGMEVNLPKLYQIVQRHGGLKKVIERKRWGRVAEEIRFTKGPNPEKKLDQFYVKYLLPYDTLSAKEREQIMSRVERAWCNKYRKMMERAFEPLHRQKKLLGESESSEDEDGSDDDEYITGALTEAEECVMQGRKMSLTKFKKIASNAKESFFPNSAEPTTAEVEEEYWRLVLLGSEHLCVISASIDTGTAGYGFTNNKNEKDGDHPWNLKNLATNNGNILRYLGAVLGVTVPTLHLGMVFSTSCWHRDPHGLPWMEFMHSGPPKIWYGIADEQSHKFRKAVESLCPSSCQNKSIWLPSDISMIPPNLLHEQNVTLSRLEQKPGEFVIVFPKAYSCSISTGYTVSESVYFASKSWLQNSLQFFSEARMSSEPTMISIEALLIAIVTDVRTPLPVLQPALGMITSLLEAELCHRLVLEDELPASTANTAVKVLKHPPGPWNVREQDDCEICRKSLFLSRIELLDYIYITTLPAKLIIFVVTYFFVSKVRELTENNSSLCLEHAVGIIKKKTDDNNPAPSFELDYYFSTEEISNIMEIGKARLVNIT